MKNNFALRRLFYQLSMTPVRIPVTAWRHRDVSAEDVFVASYPRAGSTWLRFLLQEAITGAPSTFASVNQAIPQVGFHQNGLKLPDGKRLIKTHEAWRREYQRAVYLARDPRDVVLSEHAFQTALGITRLGLDEYIEKFAFHNVSANGSWKNHLRSWMDAAAANPNIRVFRFEDLRSDTAGTLRQILSFLGISAGNAALTEAIRNNGKEQMREKELATPQKTSQRGRFVREGSSGGWKKNLTPEQARRLEGALGPEMNLAGYEAGALELRAS